MREFLERKNNLKMQIPDNFLGLEEEYTGYENARVVILPIPYEATVTYCKGAGKGPNAIIDASKQVELYDREIGKNASDIGICTLNAVKSEKNPEKMVENVYAAVKTEIDNNKFVVVLGGEHSITAGAARAFKEKFSDLSVLQIDAHSDLRDEYEGSKFNHACVMKRVFDMKIPFIQVGIRSFCDEEADFIKRNKLKPFYVEDIRNDNAWMDKAVSQLTKNVFVTIDMDGLDPSIMPSTGTPEPGGLEWYTVLDLLKKVAKAKNIVGFDVVELAPIDNLHFPDFLAAKLTYKLIGYCLFKP